eukprot:SAG31_NODE_731_length_12498_cov_7.368336_6_plen_111_part_00
MELEDAERDSLLAEYESDAAELAGQIEHVDYRCNGCGCTPIVGIRHHAHSRDNVDLCESCFEILPKSERSDYAAVMRPERAIDVTTLLLAAGGFGRLQVSKVQLIPINPN